MAASWSPSSIMWWSFAMVAFPLSASWSLTHGEYDAINLSSARTSEGPAPSLVYDEDPPLEGGARSSWVSLQVFAVSCDPLQGLYSRCVC
jgi:hypothetical protein